MASHPRPVLVTGGLQVTGDLLVTSGLLVTGGYQQLVAAGRRAGRPACWPASQLARASQPAFWPVGRRAFRPAGQPAGWMAGPLARPPAGHPASHLFYAVLNGSPAVFGVFKKQWLQITPKHLAHLILYQTWLPDGKWPI